MQIGVFDSGVGGITFLKQAKELLKNEDFIYYADQKHAPYGTKTKDEVIKYVFEAVEFIEKHKIKALVIACNTATSVAASLLRERYQFPIIGMEPAVKPALKLDHSHRILVLATPLTIKEKKLDDLINREDARARVDLLAMPELVNFAENRVFEPEIIIKYLKSQFNKYNFEDYKSIILGCTHFPFYKKIIEEVVPKHIIVMDGNSGTANQLKRVLVQNGLLEDKVKDGYITYYSSLNESRDASELSAYMKYLDNISIT